MAQTFPVRNPPETTVKSTHGVQIKVNGIVIGAITRWAPDAISKGMKHIYELNPLTSGHPIDVVPGNLGGFTIAVRRYDLWREPFEKAFGGNIELVEAIGRQDRPFEVYQYIWHPDGYKELIVFRGCWFSRVGRSYEAEGDRIIVVDGQLTFLRRDKVA